MSKESKSDHTLLRGKVAAFNLSPKGHVEGALVETRDGVVQVNFPKDDAEALAGSMRVGENVAVEAKPEGEEFAHPVYRAHAGTAGAEAHGKVVRLNYALHGEPNGAHLDNGVFVHLKPEGAKKHGLRVGDDIRATGTRREGSGGVVLEARKLERSSASRAKA